MSNESNVTYRQYNYIASKEAEAEQAGLSKANQILASPEFKTDFQPKLVTFLETWTDDQLLAFANGEISEMYMKPVLAYFWDLDRPLFADVNVAEIVAENLVPLQVEINQKLKSLFEASAWSCLLNWARPRAQTAAVDLLNFRRAAKIESPKEKDESATTVASYESTLKFAIGQHDLTNKDKAWLYKAYNKAYSIGQTVVTNNVLGSDSFSDTVVDFMTGIADETIQSMASKKSNPTAQTAWNDLLQLLYEKFFISPPPLHISESATNIPSPNRDLFLKTSYADGVKDKLKFELAGEVQQYANVVQV